MQQAPEENWLSVTQHLAELAVISQRCREAKQIRANAIIEALTEIRGYIWPEWVEMLRQNKVESISRLQEFVSSEDLTREGVNAAILMCRLLEPEGLPYLRRAIEEGSEELRVVGLKGIGDSLTLYRGRGTPQVEFWLSDQLLVRAVLQQLFHASEKEALTRYAV
jgi:hypothetical protein